MTLTVIQPESEAWDAFVAAQGGHLLQSSRWGALKRRFGWDDAIVAVAEPEGKIAAGALVLCRPLPLRAGTLAYVPRGPVVDWADRDRTAAVLAALEEMARRRRAFALKIEPDAADEAALRARLAELGLRLSPQTVQPPRTILVRLDGSEDDVLMRMSQTTRRKVRLSQKKGIVVRRGDASDVTSFSTLMRTTGARNAFGVHSEDYYRQALGLFAPDRAVLLMASYAGRDVAGLMAFRCGQRAWYLYGASSGEARERMPAYGLQWEAIRWAREGGCVLYDLWGIPDVDEATLEDQFQTRSDGLWGVYGFKRGFGGQVARSVGAWDRVYQPALYALYRGVIARRQSGAG